jgi:hypothetical protein
MAVFTKVLLSGSTSGRPISVVEVATAGDLLHTTDATDMDEVWLYAVNRHTSDVVLTIELGGVALGDTVTAVLEPNKPTLVIPGIPMTGFLEIRAFAGTTAVVSAFGWINRIG